MDRGDQPNRHSPSPASRSPRSQESELAPEDMASDCSSHSPQSSLAAAGTSAGKAAKKLTRSAKRRKRKELTRERHETGEGPAVQLRPAPVVVHEFKSSEPPAAVQPGKEQRRVTFEVAHPSKAGPKSKGRGKKGGKSKRPRPDLRKGKGKGSGKKKQPGSTKRVLLPNLR